MPTTIERLKNGEVLCPQCGEINEPGYQIGGNYDPRRYLSCLNGCERDTGRSVRVITWEDVQHELPHFSHADHDWLAKNHPEVKEAADRIEATSNDNAPMWYDRIGKSPFEMVSAIAEAQAKTYQKRGRDGAG